MNSITVHRTTGMEMNNIAVRRTTGMEMNSIAIHRTTRMEMNNIAVHRRGGLNPPDNIRMVYLWMHSGRFNLPLRWRFTLKQFIQKPTNY
ncbi:hypothetical protein [Phocaeicola sp.]